MAKVWCMISKFIKCIKVLSTPSQKTRKYFCQNPQVKFDLFTIAKPTLIISACGVTSKEDNKTEFNISEKVVHNVALATIALKDGNIEKSADILSKTLDFAEMSNFPSGIISVCELLSSLEIKLGEYNKAEKLLNKTLESLRNQGLPEDDNSMINLILKLSRIYSNQGNDDLAELNFIKCLKMQESKLNDNTDEETFLLWSSILYWYGKFLLAKNRFQEAKCCFKDCFLTSTKLDELLPNQIMVILYNLGEVCLKLKEHDEAMQHFLKGVSLDKKCKNPDLTYFYSKLGVVSMCKGLYKEAKDWCDGAQKLALKYQNHDAVKESNECLQKLNAVLVHQ